MSWITDVAPKIKTLFKRDAPDSLWIKCPDSGQVVFQKDVEANQWVIPGSGHHMRLSAIQRLTLTFDGGQWTDVPVPDEDSDPLKFRDTKRYTDRLKEARTKTGLADAIKVSTGTRVCQNSNEADPGELFVQVHAFVPRISRSTVAYET